MLAGTHYTSSGRFKPINTLITLVIVGTLAVFSGMLYGLITSINPIVYLNFLVLGGEVFLLVILMMFVKTLGKSRNGMVNLFTATFICFIAWLSHWSYYMNELIGGGTWHNLFHPMQVLDFVGRYGNDRNIEIGQLGSGGLPLSGSLLMLIYLIEFLVFMVPIYFALKTDYYCENCEEYYTSKTVYSGDIDQFRAGYDNAQPGEYGFLEPILFMPSIDGLFKDPSNRPEILKADYHYCKKCNQDSIIDFSAAVLGYNDKKRRELSKENSLLKGMYIDSRTNQLFQQKIGLNEPPKL